MKKAVIFLTDGFEEMEAIVPADILHRAGVGITFTSITGKLEVKGSHDITIIADNLLSENVKGDMFILPGGPGASEYVNNPVLIDLLRKQNNDNKYIAAICAAPLTLGSIGLLNNKAATCFPHLTDKLVAGERRSDAVVTDGNITTGRAAGVSAEFGLRLAEILAGADEANRIKSAMFID